MKYKGCFCDFMMKERKNGMDALTFLPSIQIHIAIHLVFLWNESIKCDWKGCHSIQWIWLSVSNMIDIDNLESSYTLYYYTLRGEILMKSQEL